MTKEKRLRTSMRYAEAKIRIERDWRPDMDRTALRVRQFWVDAWRRAYHQALYDAADITMPWRS